MADFESEIQRLDDLIAELSDPSLLSGLTVSALETTALVKNRILNQKQDANGNAFGSYSEKKVPKFFLLGKSLSSSAEDKIKNGDPFASYKDLRTANNLPTDRKNYSFSGKMLQNLGIVSSEAREGVYTVKIGGQTPRAKKLLFYNSQRDGINLLEPSKQEAKLVVEAANERVIEIINRYYQ